MMNIIWMKRIAKNRGLHPNTSDSKYSIYTLQIMPIELALERLALPWKLLKDRL